MRSLVRLFGGNERERRAILSFVFALMLVAAAIWIVVPPAAAGGESACGHVQGEVADDGTLLDAFDIDSLCADSFNVTEEEGTATFDAGDSEVTSIATEQYTASFDATGARFGDATGSASVTVENGDSNKGTGFNGDASAGFDMNFVIPEGGTGSVFARVSARSSGSHEGEGLGDAHALASLEGPEETFVAEVELLQEGGPGSGTDSLGAGDLPPGLYRFDSSVSINSFALNLEPGEGGKLTGDFDVTITVSAPQSECTNEFTAGNDEITGTPDNDVLCGGGGNDTIDGGGGNDTIYGGRGNDTIFGGADNDTILGGPGEDGIETGAGDDTAHGEGANDDIVGGSSSGCESDTEGNPRLDDLFEGGNGEDVILGCGGADLIIGGDDGDFISGNHGHDNLAGNDGGDDIFGDQGNDALFGHGGNDDLIGGPGDEVSFSGGGARPGLVGGSGEDGIEGGPGDDFISGGDDDDGIDGGPGSDRLEGDGGADRMVGGGRKDVFRGGDGGDTLLSRDGVRDVLHGNAGRDKARVDGRDDVDGVEEFL